MDSNAAGAKVQSRHGKRRKGERERERIINLTIKTTEQVRQNNAHNNHDKNVQHSVKSRPLSKEAPMGVRSLPWGHQFKRKPECVRAIDRSVVDI